MKKFDSHFSLSSINIVDPSPNSSEILWAPSRKKKLSFIFPAPQKGKNGLHPSPSTKRKKREEKYTHIFGCFRHLPLKHFCLDIDITQINNFSFKTIKISVDSVII